MRPRHTRFHLLSKKKTKEDLPARKLTPAQNALIDKAVAREAEVVKVVKERAPLVETYIQNMKPDPALLQVPESDQHFLGRVDFNKVIGDNAYETKAVAHAATKRVCQQAQRLQGFARLHHQPQQAVASAVL